MSPSLSVVHTVPSRRRNDAPALSSPPKPTDPSTRPSTNHLKPTGTSSSRRPRSATTRSIIDELTSVLPTATSAPQSRPPPNRYEMAAAITWLGFIESGARDHDPVPVRVRVVAQREVEPVAQPHQSRHRERRRRVHPDLPVPVEGHEPELRVDRVVGDRQVEAVPLADRAPVVDRGAAERIDAQPKPGARDGLHVDDRAQVRDVGAHEVVLAGGGPRPLERHARDAVEAVRTRRLEDPVRLVLDPARDVGVRRAAVGRVVLEAAVVGRVVRRRDDDPVARGAVPPVVVQRSRFATRIACETAGVGVNPSPESTRTSTPRATSTSSAVRHAGSLSACVSRPDEQRARVSLRCPVAADRLGRREDVRLVERRPERGSAMARRAERHALGGVGRVGPDLVVRAEQGRDVNELGRDGGLAGARVLAHRGPRSRMAAGVALGPTIPVRSGAGDGTARRDDVSGIAEWRSGSVP